MKKMGILAVLPALLMGTGAFANTGKLTFAGNCTLSLHGKAFNPIDSFQLEAGDGDCPNKTMEFSVPGNGGATQYGIYVEFQRSEFGPGLRDKPYFGYYKKSDGAVSNSAQGFNAKRGTVLTFEQALEDDARLYCTGAVK